MTSSSDLAYVDSTRGRDYNTGSKETFKSGSEIDFESGSSLKIAGTQVTSNATELNSVDGVSTSWPTLLPGAPTFTINSESSNSILVEVQLNDSKGNAIAASKVVLVYLSDDSAGDGITSNIPDGDVAIGTDGTILTEHVTDGMFVIWTESDGQFDVNIGESSADTYYMCIVIGSNLYVSSAITFA